MSDDPSTAPLRFGIIGCGVIGKVHARAIASLPEAELAAVADSVPDLVEALAHEHGVQAFHSLEAMLTEANLDVVNVCTPSGMHGDHAIAVMRGGRHVIVEKPLEITLDRIDKILSVQRESGVVLSVISQHRFDPSTLRVRALVDEGAFGRLVLGNAHVLWWRSQGYYDSGAWRGTWALDGGGVLMNQSIHCIDLLIALMGPVAAVRALTDTRVHRMETEDVAVASLRFRNGALGTLACTTGAYPGYVTRVELFGDRGSASIQNDELAYLHLARDDVEEAGAYGSSPQPVHAGNQGASSNPAAVPSDTHARQIADTIRAIRTGTSPEVTGEVARHPVEVILAVYESARTGREVTLS